MLDITRLHTNDASFWAQMKDLLAWDNVSDNSVQSTVRQILSDVRREGDKALVDYTNKFDRMDAADMSVLSIPKDRLQQALDFLPADQRLAL
jgi:histidinol dehydrogenase